MLTPELEMILHKNCVNVQSYSSYNQIITVSVKHYLSKS